MSGKRSLIEDKLTNQYIVWCPTSSKPPTTVFDSIPEAIKAACGMARCYPGTRFTVCKIVGSACTGDVSYVDSED